MNFVIFDYVRYFYKSDRRVKIVVCAWYSLVTLDCDPGEVTALKTTVPVVTGRRMISDVGASATISETISN